jgi:ketosteroid isomerase-like protein
MKKYLLLFTAIIMVSGISCQKKVDIEKEKQAIMAVINAESETARTGDVNGLSSCYIQDEYNTRFMVGKNNYQILTGWDKLAPLFESLKANAEIDDSVMTFTKENEVVKVTGNTAWVICENNWKMKTEEGERKVESIQITFLEKVDGVWKFSFAAWIPKPEPEVATAEPEAAK